METPTNKIRQMILDMTVQSGRGHLGGSLSCVEILWALYSYVLNSDDIFILSKGHAASALYAVLALKGLLTVEELKTFCQRGSRLEGHPTIRVPGIIVNTGSLGQGLGIACGIALAKKLKRETGRVFVLISDGELYEGSTWEAIHFAPEVPLNNLIAIIDYNNQTVLKEINDCYIKKKFEAFYWVTTVADGHNVDELCQACRIGMSHPVAMIAKTIKGKGISFIEGKIGYHQGFHNADEIALARKELG